MKAVEKTATKVSRFSYVKELGKVNGKKLKQPDKNYFTRRHNALKITKKTPLCHCVVV
jgi:uncharacterized protein YlbG (UPF0298 family)